MGDLINWHQLYEELRREIDNGHESMTHEDAIEWVKEAHDAMWRLDGLSK